jgi:uncharacterized protein YndB with AHSA1/START domain
MQPTAKVTRTIPAPADEVWKALTTPETIKRYMFGAEVEADWRVGGRVRFHGEYGGKAYEDKGEIRSFEPEKRLAYTHWSSLSGAPDKPENYHLVTYELAPEGEATRVTLTQSNVDGEVTEADREHRGQYEENWTKMLEGLERAIAP